LTGVMAARTPTAPAHDDYYLNWQKGGDVILGAGSHKSTAPDAGIAGERSHYSDDHANERREKPSHQTFKFLRNERAAESGTREMSDYAKLLAIDEWRHPFIEVRRGDVGGG